MFCPYVINHMPREQVLRKPSPEEEAAHAAYNALQIRAMLGQENKKRARDYYGHEPSDEEAAMFFVKSGQAKKFREDHERPVKH